MKKLLTTAMIVGMSTLLATAQTYPDKANKKNNKALEQSAKITDAGNEGKSNKALRHMDKMAKKADKVNKKAGKFK